MILEPGNHILVVHRRLFEKDRGRFFVGAVEAYEQGIVKTHGYTWVLDTFHGTIVKKEDSRTKIFSLSAGTLIIYVLPDSTDLRLLKIDYDREGRIKISDGKELNLDLSEGVHKEPEPNKGRKIP